MDYVVHLGVFFAIYAILALSLNLVVGYAGPLSVAHAAFYGLGAYSTAILTTGFSLGFFASLIVGMVVALVVSILIGVVLSKLDDDDYIIASVGFNVIAVSVFINWTSLTHGPFGITSIPRPTIFGFFLRSNTTYLAFCVLALLIVYLVCRGLVSSSFGRVLKAIREDEKAIQVFGYNTWNYKLAVYAISAMMAATAGSLFAAYITFIDPSTFTINVSDKLGNSPST